MINLNNHNFHIHNDDLQERESIVIEYDFESTDPDCDSAEVSSNLNGSGLENFQRIGMIKIGEGSREYELMRNSFLRTMGIDANHFDILTVHRNSVVDPVMGARKTAFQISAKAIAEKCGGDPNIWLAWYPGSTEEICRVILYGFSGFGETVGGESHGIGIHLFPAKFPLDSVNSSIVKSKGVNHLLLCRVIMGKMEPIPFDSKQIQPSSRKYDSGVDNVSAPRRLTVWTAFMNSHIFPLHVISFRPSSVGRNPIGILKPSTPWLSLPGLIITLSKSLDPSKMALVLKFHKEFREHKISRLEMIKAFRRIVGDRLLAEIIKSKFQAQSILGTRNWHPR